MIRAEVDTGPVVVIGAGIVGLAIARTLILRGHRVIVLEKEDRVAAHQTGHNSGVVHSGIYYQPGSLKAALCRRGGAMLQDYCRANDLVYREIGKLIVATTDRELAQLDVLAARAEANGVPDVVRLDAAGIRRIEPNVVGLGALHSPHTAIVDYTAVCRALAAEIEANGGEVHLSTEVRGFSHADTGVVVRTRHRELLADRVVICAGLQADRVGHAAGDTRGPTILPFRGEYYRLAEARAGLVRGLVYPVPDPRYPFLGVHFTPRVDGSVDIGPNAVFALAREGYTARQISAPDVIEALAWPGTLKLFAKNLRAGIGEMLGSWSKRRFAAAARTFVPSLTVADLSRAPAGVRAQAVDRDGSMVDDFRISTIGRITAVRNAPSPAATSSLAIAEYVVDRFDTPAERGQDRMSD